MKILWLLAGLVYAVTVWFIGMAFRAGGGAQRLFCGAILLAIAVAVAYVSSLNDVRLHYIGLYSFLSIFPAILGYMGIVPIPGIVFND